MFTPQQASATHYCHSNQKTGSSRLSILITAFCFLGLVALCLAPTTYATTFNTQFQHVIIVVQENRTPDNLFYADTFLATTLGGGRAPARHTSM